VTNRYSTTWFETFLETISPGQTESEIAFLRRQLPLPAYRRVLDLACGRGRHAAPLARLGYAVTGLDHDPMALDAARRRSGSEVRYVEGDMRDLSILSEPFDVVINLWQSFGHFDPATNAGVLRQIAERVPGSSRPCPAAVAASAGTGLGSAGARDGPAVLGRLVLDVYHRGFFERHQGVRPLERHGRTVAVETKSMRGDRLTVRLDYGPGQPPDRLDWQLYTPEELVALARECGFSCLLTCSGFDEHTPVSPDDPRMQLVFEKS